MVVECGSLPEMAGIAAWWIVTPMQDVTLRLIPVGEPERDTVREQTVSLIVGAALE
jgi:hypothetical protein